MRIYILSRDIKIFSTSRLVEEARNRGHAVEVVDYLNCQLVVEQGNPHIYYNGKELPMPDAIVPRIAASRTFFGCAVVRQFEMLKVFTSVKSQAIVRSRDKLRSMQILSKQGVGMPITAFASHPNDLRKLIKAVGGTPIIIKLLEGTQGKGVVLAESYNAAKSALDAFYGLKANILIQEYVKESKGADLRVFIVNGEVVAAMRRQGVLGEFRSNLHQGGSAESIKLTDEERDVAVHAAKALGLAVAGVDLLQSSRGPLIMEVNSSPGIEGIEATTGVNVAEKIIQFVEDHSGYESPDVVGH